MAALTLVVGGVRSGKSRLAERLVAAAPPVTYLATAFAGDAEMGRRIEVHRLRRPAAWRTVEEPWDLPRAVAGVTGGGVLVECLSLWVTNLLVGLPGRDGLEDGDVLRRVDELAAAAGPGLDKVVL